MAKRKRAAVKRSVKARRRIGGRKFKGKVMTKKRLTKVKVKIVADAHNSYLIDRKITTNEVAQLLSHEPTAFFKPPYINTIGGMLKNKYFERANHTYRMNKSNVFDGTNIQAAVGGIVLNDMFDPDPAGGGNQPSGRDAMANKYSRYIVLGGSVKATIWNDTPAHVTIGMVILGADGPTWTQRLVESEKTSKKKHYVKKNFSGGSADNDSERKSLSLSWKNPAQFHSHALTSDTETVFGGITGASPTTDIHAELVGVQTYFDAAIAAGVDVHWEATYDVMWYHPVDMFPHND